MATVAITDRARVLAYLTTESGGAPQAKRPRRAPGAGAPHPAERGGDDFLPVPEDIKLSDCAQLHDRNSILLSRNKVRAATTSGYSVVSARRWTHAPAPATVTRRCPRDPAQRDEERPRRAAQGRQGAGRPAACTQVQPVRGTHAAARTLGLRTPSLLTPRNDLPATRYKEVQEQRFWQERLGTRDVDELGIDTNASFLADAVQPLPPGLAPAPAPPPQPKQPAAPQHAPKMAAPVIAPGRAAGKEGGIPIIIVPSGCGAAALAAFAESPRLE